MFHWLLITSNEICSALETANIDTTEMTLHVDSHWLTLYLSLSLSLSHSHILSLTLSVSFFFLFSLCLSFDVHSNPSCLIDQHEETKPSSNIKTLSIKNQLSPSIKWRKLRMRWKGWKERCNTLLYKLSVKSVCERIELEPFHLRWMMLRRLFSNISNLDK